MTAQKNRKTLPLKHLPELDVDDLKKIEGIGPKIASILVASGILKFEQLSKTEVLTFGTYPEKRQPSVCKTSNMA